MDSRSALQPGHAVLAHPVAELFPLLEGAAFDELAEDIQRHGLRDPILVDADGRILDGRNRWRACERAGVTPRTATWTDGDPTSLIISRNLHRRHLTDSQRALIAARLAPQSTAGRPGKSGKFAELPTLNTAAASEVLHVSPRTIGDARVVLSAQSAVIDAVERGDLAVSAAASDIRAGRDPLAVHFSSGSPEHYTPSHILAAVVECLGAIDLDPCSNSHDVPHVPAAQHFTRADDGLAQPWHGRVFMNPPYGREIDPWIAKLVAEVTAGRVTQAIALVPARIDTAWWQRMRDYIWCAIDGRLTFIGNRDAAPFPSAVVYLDGDGCGYGEFYRAFAGFGDIWQRIEPGMFGE